MINFRILNADFFEVQISTLTPERYPRVYQSRTVTTDRIKIYAIENDFNNRFDFQRVLFHGTLFNEITIDGIAFADAQTLSNELNTVLYSNLSAFATTDYVNAQLLLKQNLSEKNQPNGYAGLGADGLIPNNLISTIFDDVIDVADLNFTGEPGKIYQNTTDNKLYRWSGTAFVEVSSGVSQAYVDTKVSLTSDETINGIKTFVESPIVSDGNSDFEVVNFRQLEKKQDKLIHHTEKTIQLSGFEQVGYGYVDINVPLNVFIGSVKISINAGTGPQLQPTLYEKLFTEVYFSNANLDRNVIGKVLFNNGFFKFSTEIIKVLGNTGFTIRIYKNSNDFVYASLIMEFEDHYYDHNAIIPLIYTSPFLSLSLPTFEEPKAIPVTIDPDAAIVPVQSEIGNIEFTDFDGGIFIDLATARAYVQQFTTAVISNESFSQKTYRFSVPMATVFAQLFLRGTNSRFEFNDPLGYIGEYGADCFSNNNQQFKIKLGNNVALAANCFNNNFENFDIEIGDNSYFTFSDFSNNKKYFNAKIGSNCNFTNYQFYQNQLGFGVEIGDNCTFGSNCFTETAGGIIDIKIGNFLTAYFYFIRDNATTSTNILIGDNATVGSDPGDSFFGNGNLTAKIGRFFSGSSVLNGNCKKVTIESILFATNSFNKYVGRLKIYSDYLDGIIGTTSGQDFTNCFQNPQDLILILQTETATTSFGNPDEDIQVAINNGINLDNLRYIL